MARPRKVQKPARRPRGSGTVTTLRDGRIRARLPAAVDPKRTAREFPAGRRDLAEAWLLAMLQPQDEAPPAAISLGDWAGIWYDTYVVPIRPETTARTTLYALRKLEPLFRTAVTEVRPSALQAVVGQLAASISPVSIAAVVGVWRRCLEAAVDDGLIARNPAKRLTLPPAPPKPARRFVTPSEARAILAASVGHRFEAAYALLIGCGLRIGEVLGLSWEHVDLARRRAWIGPQWTESRWRPLPKNREGRWIALPPVVVAALIRHRDRQPPGCVLVMESPHAANVGRGKRKRGHEARPWSRGQVSDDLKKLVAELGLDAMSPHSARRGLASALLESGVNPAVIADLLGHKDANTTLKHYTLPSDDGRRRADKKVDEYLGSGQEP